MGAEEEVAERGGQETVPGVLPVPVPQNPKGHNHPLLVWYKETRRRKEILKPGPDLQHRNSSIVLQN